MHIKLFDFLEIVLCLYLLTPSFDGGSLWQGIM